MNVVQEIHEGLDFSIHRNPRYVGIFSVKFSTDGREIVAGSNDDSIYGYDLEANKLSFRISAHTVCILYKLPNFSSIFNSLCLINILFIQADVNTVCYADETGHLLFSGSDDTYCKVPLPNMYH